jgi:hypothetical protein
MRDEHFGKRWLVMEDLNNGLLLDSHELAFRHCRSRRYPARLTNQATFAYRLWLGSSWLNQRHMLFAWTSLFWVGFADFYVRMVSMGRFHDVSTWGF